MQRTQKCLYKNVFPLVLASASPRRRALLESVGIKLRVIPSHVDERDLTSREPPFLLVRKLAEEKAMDVFSRIKEEAVIGADTIVVLDGQILGKPGSIEKAVEMLKLLNGKTHKVLTGVSLVNPHPFMRVYTWHTETLVTFRNVTSEEIMSYVKTMEPIDKAGGYGIQELAACFVEKIEGSYTNVVGLPLAETVSLLLRLGIIRPVN